MDRKLEAAVGEFIDRFISVVHAEHNTGALKLVNGHFCCVTTISWGESHGECACLLGDKVSCSVLVSEGVSSNHNWSSPSWNTSWDVFDDDWFTEDSSSHNVSDCTVGGFPHLFQVELFDTSFIWGNGGTFYSNFACFDSIRAINSYLIISSVTIFNA